MHLIIREIIDFIINKDDHYFNIEVKDTGIGMTEDEKANLFKEFMRAKNEHTKDISGTGLGLSIIKKIVDLNKGKILVDSQINFGSAFTVKIPA